VSEKQRFTALGQPYRPSLHTAMPTPATISTVQRSTCAGRAIKTPIVTIEAVMPSIAAAVCKTSSNEFLRLLA
jgi:hypothetical protein